MNHTGMKILKKKEEICLKNLGKLIRNVAKSSTTNCHLDIVHTLN